MTRLREELNRSSTRSFSKRLVVVRIVCLDALDGRVVGITIEIGE